MEMALAMNATEFTPLTFDELMEIDGGVNWEHVGTGLGILSATCIAVACAPATAFVGASAVAMAIGCAAGGYAAGCYIGMGLRG